MKKAIYAGSFDPLTNGHSWLIDEAAHLFDEVFVVIANNPSKKYYFSLTDRIKFIETQYANNSKVKVVVLQDDYVAQYAIENNITHLVRGIRNNEDFGPENTVLTLNKLIAPQIHSVHLIPPLELSVISSSNVKNLVGFPRWPQVVKTLVSPIVISHFQQKIYKDTIREYWNTLNINDEDTFEYIINQYSASGRAYHTLEHVADLLDKTKLSSVLDKNQVIYLSILFHDLVYDTTKMDNEDQSAEKFLEFANKNKLAKDVTQMVELFIRATKTHSNPSKNDLLSHFLDLDLSILAADKRRFVRYEEEIRLEYHSVPDAIYEVERAKIMKRLATDTFKTKWAQDLWNSQKEINLSHYK